MAVSGGLSTVWGFCRLGGRYFKTLENVILCRIKFHTTQHQTMFHSDDNCSELCAILDDLPTEINVFSHICILHRCLHLQTVIFSQFNCLLRLGY